MQFLPILVASVAIPLVAGYLVAPPAGSTPAPETTEDCSAWTIVVEGDTCTSVITEYGTTLAFFEAMNPITIITGACTLSDDFAYCVDENFDSTGSSSSSSSSFSSTSTTLTTVTTTPTTTSGDGITTPTPFQTGMITSCDAFHLVVSGDECGTIATEYGLTLTQFYAWNPAVGSTCEFLDLGDYVCVGLIGAASTTTTTPSTTGDGISTPTPYQTGMAANCDSFHLVVSGDTCAAVASAAGVSLTNFYAWNPAVGSACEYLDLGDYVCIDVIGVTASTTTTTSTTTGNGISTPTPYQTGIASNCDSFHLVVSGDTCAAIVATAGISLAEFYSWNPAVGTSCEYLDLGDYVCIDVIGVTVTTTTASSTTTSGNGITTPTPYQAGMVSDCDSFHLVVSGDTCDAIVTAAGITLAEFYTWNPAVGTTCEYLDLGDYVCINVL